MLRDPYRKAYCRMMSSPSKHKAAREWRKNPRLFSTMHNTLLSCARCALWSLLLIAILAFWMITFARPTGWYRDDRGGHFQVVWELLELCSTTVQQDGKKTIMPGMISAQVRSPTHCFCTCCVHENWIHAAASMLFSNVHASTSAAVVLGMIIVCPSVHVVAYVTTADHNISASFLNPPLVCSMHKLCMQMAARQLYLRQTHCIDRCFCNGAQHCWPPSVC